ncbi:hypothetical protein KSP39_PZI006802 [Platanthera zijinensis]|uniref:Uncharacterized protein n=1 Tax=Platanthera zijinensis TaxID=2320716 RepID=A0AAP0BPH3_9ASPA
MSGLRRLLSPIKASMFSTRPSSPCLSIPRNSTCGRSGLLNILPKHVYPESETHILAFGRLLQRKTLHSVSLAGKKLFVRSFLSFSVATGSIYQQKSVVYAMDDIYADMAVEEPSGFLKDDLHTFWSLARKFQLPVVLLITVLLGWRHPIALAINVTFLLFCTRPNPMSIYMFVEQFLYVKKVEVEDYKILCLARVEVRDFNMDVIGILGGWWVFQTSRSHGP